MAYTLITGASQGLGVEFARLAARENRNLILSAPEEHKLNALAQDLRDTEVDVVVLPADLSKMTEVKSLWKAATKGRVIDVFVNNAGLGTHGAFADPDTWTREKNIIEVNLIAYTYLMKQAAAHMAAQGTGRILNVSSIMGTAPSPQMAVYGATKAYALSLSEALACELQGTGVTVTTLCPGTLATGFLATADIQNARCATLLTPMKPFAVAEEGWLESRIGKGVVVPGVLNKLFVLQSRVLPRKLLARLTRFFLAKA